MNNQILLITLFLFFFSTSLFSQRERMDEDQLEAIKIGYITKQLALTSDEAKVFWPVYDEFTEEVKAHRKVIHKHKLEAELNEDDITDEDAEKMLEEMVKHREAEIELQKKYIKEFKKVLPVKKVAKLFRVEHEFRAKLLKQLGGRGHRGPPPGRGPGSGFD